MLCHQHTLDLSQWRRALIMCDAGVVLGQISLEGQLRKDVWWSSLEAHTYSGPWLIKLTYFLWSSSSVSNLPLLYFNLVLFVVVPCRIVKISMSFLRLYHWTICWFCVVLFKVTQSKFNEKRYLPQSNHNQTGPHFMVFRKDLCNILVNSSLYPGIYTCVCSLRPTLYECFSLKKLSN